MNDRDARPLFTPAPERAASTRLARWITSLRERGVVPSDVRDAHALQRWSVTERAAFWREIWHAAGIRAEAVDGRDAASPVLLGGDRMAPPDPALGPHWFPNARLSFAEHLLARRDDAPALVAWDETGRYATHSFAELAQDVARAAAAMAALGVGPGHRVVGWLPNVPAAVVAMLAANALGATWSSCSPDFGVRGVLDRFGQIAPTLLVAANGYRYAGKLIDCRPRLAEIVAALPGLRATWVVDQDRSGAMPDGDGYHRWRDVLANASTSNASTSNASTSDAPSFVRLPFDHPLYILYSSGTTGLPKAIVHGAGGTLLQHWKELALHTDLRAGDAIFYFTTCGWMMWNWLVSSLAVGATVVLYDGAPMPAAEPDLLWRMAAAERVRVFGTSAKYLALCEKAGLTPGASHDLGALDAILSTGSPLAEHSYDWVYTRVRAEVRLASISGGTDIVSCFALGDPTGAVWRGELQMRGLGMAVEVWDDDGAPVTEQAGELVCTKPFPSMPVRFWNDDDGAKYRAAYFEHYPGVWRHGDWAEITAHDGLVIHGRSDATLNPGGVRIGTAEIYRQVEQIPAVLESLVTEYAEEGAGGTEARIVLFVRLRDGFTLDESLRDEIRRAIRAETSPHHVPKVIAEVPDIPRTISGKIVELAVREALHGRPVKNVSALANPEALAAFRPALVAASAAS